ncbi:CBL-interacting protein kinase 24 [Camellia lanceoleosa]|uniref:CBL-interacting protein kinase 24 n=1 Tax=Camellia lanceoleosa TaxID=1840588 RepID=A0ACC0GJ39_9ERIC|nr:CBL-interacting protein kinase 24 [Camellia lanceoleosa]
MESDSSTLSQDQYVTEQSTTSASGPLIMNAFEMITLSQGLNLSALFDRRQDYVKRQTRFVSRQPTKLIISTIEAVAESMGLKVHTRYYKGGLKPGGFFVLKENIARAGTLFMFLTLNLLHYG